VEERLIKVFNRSADVNNHRTISGKYLSGESCINDLWA